MNLVVAYKLLHDGKLALARAERQGIRVDVDYCRRKTAELAEEIRSLRAKLARSDLGRAWRRRWMGSTNFASDHQLAAVLDMLGLAENLGTTKKGRTSVDETNLRSLNHPDVGTLIRLRKLTKIRNTYFGQFLREQVGGYIHPFYSLHTVQTYRSSSSNPNFQNIPYRDEEAKKVCRRALFPRPGHQLLSVDYSGLEVSIAACYHQDPTMIRYLEDPSSDMHADQADEIFFVDRGKWGKTAAYKRLRYGAKNGFVFPEFYGDYFGNCAKSLAVTWAKLPEGGRWRRGQGIELPDGRHLAEHLASQGIQSLKGFTDHIERIEDNFWGERFPVYDRWRRRQWARYQRRGYLDMKTGFRCSGLMRKNQVTNTPIQGAAFHCLLWSFIEVDKVQRKERWRSRLIGQIHDSMILDVYPPELDHVMATIRKVTCVDLLRAWDWIVVPLSVDFEICPVDGSWAEMDEMAA